MLITGLVLMPIPISSCTPSFVSRWLTSVVASCMASQPARDRLGRVVVTGDGGSEDDEDRVADEIVDGALVAAVAGEAAAGSISPTIEST
jgi:hypothetical protein